MLAKIGPGANIIWRRPVVGSSLMMSVPVMSDGIRSGVNWMRLNLRSSTRASEWMSSVLASPGTPDDEAVAADEQREQHLADDVVLADDELAQLRDNLLASPLHPVGKRYVVLIKILDSRHRFSS
jgi:hypothetical protein